MASSNQGNQGTHQGSNQGTHQSGNQGANQSTDQSTKQGSKDPISKDSGSSSNRGAAAMDQDKQREMANKGGKPAHDSGQVGSASQGGGVGSNQAGNQPSNQSGNQSGKR